MTSTTTHDTVVTYDVMRETANSLVASLLNSSIERGGQTPHDVVIERIRAVNDAVAAVPARDVDAIATATLAFAAQLDVLAGV